jgi:hypothetical protein
VAHDCSRATYCRWFQLSREEAFFCRQEWFSGLDGAVRSARGHLHKPGSAGSRPTAHQSTESTCAIYRFDSASSEQGLQGSRLKPTRFFPGVRSIPSPQSFLLIRRSGRLHRREHSRPRSMPMMDDETCGPVWTWAASAAAAAKSKRSRAARLAERPAPGLEWVWLQVKQIGKRREVTCKGQPNGSVGVPDGARNRGLVDRLRRPLTGTSTTLGRHQGGTQQAQRALFMRAMGRREQLPMGVKEDSHTRGRIISQAQTINTCAWVAQQSQRVRCPAGYHFTRLNRAGPPGSPFTAAHNTHRAPKPPRSPNPPKSVLVSPCHLLFAIHHTRFYFVTFSIDAALPNTSEQHPPFLPSAALENKG